MIFGPEVKALVPRFNGIIEHPDLPHNDYIRELNFTIWVLIAAAAGFYGLRIYCKLYRQRGLWWDDHMLSASFVALSVSGILASYSTIYGFGKHIYDVKSHDLPPLLLVLDMSGFFSLIAAAWSKTSFAITLLRISEGRTRIVIWFIIASVNIVLGLAALFSWIQCTPVERTWNPFVQGTCWNPKIFIVFNSFAAAYSGLMDIVLAILPWRIIGKVTMRKKERIGMLVAMSMGVFAGITSIAKTITIPAFAKSDLINTVPLSIMGIAESAVTIIAASIPVLRALIRGQSSRLGRPTTTPRHFLLNTSLNSKEPNDISVSDILQPPRTPPPLPSLPRSATQPISLPGTPSRNKLTKAKDEGDLGDSKEFSGFYFFGNGRSLTAESNV